MTMLLIKDYNKLTKLTVIKTAKSLLALELVITT